MQQLLYGRDPLALIGLQRSDMNQGFVFSILRIDLERVQICQFGHDVTCLAVREETIKGGGAR